MGANSELTFGARLRLHREAAELTQAELAQAVGCAVVTVWRYENDRQHPGGATLRRLGEVLNTSVDELLGVVA